MTDLCALLDKDIATRRKIVIEEFKKFTAYLHSEMAMDDMNKYMIYEYLKEEVEKMEAKMRGE